MQIILPKELSNVRNRQQTTYTVDRRPHVLYKQLMIRPSADGVIIEERGGRQQSYRIAESNRQQSYRMAESNKIRLPDRKV